MERSHYNWCNRPAHTGPPPLIDYILPMLQKKQEKDSLLRHTLQSAKAADAQNNQQPSERERLLQASLPPMTMARSLTWAPPSNNARGMEQCDSVRQSARME